MVEKKGPTSGVPSAIEAIFMILVSNRCQNTKRYTGRLGQKNFNMLRAEAILGELHHSQYKYTRVGQRHLKIRPIMIVASILYGF